MNEYWIWRYSDSPTGISDNSKAYYLRTNLWVNWSGFLLENMCFVRYCSTSFSSNYEFQILKKKNQIKLQDNTKKTIFTIKMRYDWIFVFNW